MEQKQQGFLIPSIRYAIKQWCTKILILSSITVPFLLLLRTYGTHYNFEYYIDSIISIIPDYLWHNMTLLWLINLLHASQWGTLIDREYHKKMLTDCLYRVCSAIKVERSVDERTLNPQLLPSIQQQLHFHLPLSFQQEPYNNPWWVSIDLNQLTMVPNCRVCRQIPHWSTRKQCIYMSDMSNLMICIRQSSN